MSPQDDGAEGSFSRGGLPSSAADPTTSLLFVERGALTITLDVPVQPLRAIGEGTPFAELGKEMPAGTEFMLNFGDSILVPSGSTGEVMNNGTEAAVVLIAELAPERAFGDEDSTPETKPDRISRITPHRFAFTEV